MSRASRGERARVGECASEEDAESKSRVARHRCQVVRIAWGTAEIWGLLGVAALCCGGARRCWSEQSLPPARARTVIGVFECVVGSRRGERLSLLRRRSSDL